MRKRKFFVYRAVVVKAGVVTGMSIFSDGRLDKPLAIRYEPNAYLAGEWATYLLVRPCALVFPGQEIPGELGSLRLRGSRSGRAGRPGQPRVGYS